MIINISSVWDDVAVEHNLFLNRCIDSFLDFFYFRLPGPPQEHEALLARFMQRNRERIANARNSNLMQLIRDYDRRFPWGSDLRKKARSLLSFYLNYETFANKATPGWNAYSLCAGARWTVCPYCHIQGTETEVADEQGRGYRPQLDHYYGKADYPFLALSLANLIPCCGRCNGPGFKHKIDFAKNPHLNPLVDVENIRFALDFADPDKVSDPIVSAYRGALSDYVLKVEMVGRCERTSASIHTFQLSKLYKRYVGDAKRIAYGVRLAAEEIKLAGSASSRATMVSDAIGVQIDSNRHVAFNISSPTEYKNVPTGKMQLDIYSAVAAM